MKHFVFCILVLLTFANPLLGQPPTTQRIIPNSTVFIEPMAGFETYLTAAIIKKKTPLIVVDNEGKAAYIISGVSSIEKAGWAKTIFFSPAPAAHASITLKDAKTGQIIYAYSVDKIAANRGTQSTAEACAKHLKEQIDSEKK